jgi:hypothetical protein
MMHDRLLGRLTCNLLLYTLLDGGLKKRGASCAAAGIGGGAAAEARNKVRA